VVQRALTPFFSKGLKVYAHFPEVGRERGWPIHVYTFTRFGGVSPSPYKGLNLSLDVGDLRENVLKNQKKIEEFLSYAGIRWLRQCHSANVHVVDGSVEWKTPQGDAMITAAQGVPLGILHADCQAVVLFDDDQGVISNIHCGWRGLVNGVIDSCMEILTSRFGTSPRNVWASISPAIGRCCFEFRGWRRELPPNLHQYVEEGRFDMVQATRERLQYLGIPGTQIFASSICTACFQEFFSYRRDGVTGRCATVVVKAG